MTSETVPWMLSDAVGAYLNKISFYAPLVRYRRGLSWQNLLLRPAGPRSPGLILTESLSAPRCSDIAGAYFSRISCCAPISRYRRGLLQQNSYLRPDIPVLTGLITAKSLSAPRYPGIDRAYYGKILICAPMYKGGGYNRPGLVSHTRVCEGRWVYST